MIAGVFRSTWFFVALLGAGVALRVLAMFFVVPTIQTEWFVPFFQSFVENPSVDPWGNYLDGGGDPQAFPYGPVMIAVFALGAFLTSWLPEPWGVQVGLVATIALLEAAVWLIAAAWFRPTARRTLLVLSLSPILIYVNFIHGQLDILPTLLMFASAWFIRSKRWFTSGVLIGIAVAAKFSSLLLAPIVLVFLLRNARFRAGWRRYLLGMLPGIALALAPAVLPGYRTMVLQTPTTKSVVSYAADLGPGLTIVILPVVYALILVVQYRYKRANPDVVVLVSGIALTAVTLLTPASPGWYLWAVPFLVVTIAKLDSRVVAFVWLFWAVATATLASRASGALWRYGQSFSEGLGFVEPGPFSNEIGNLGAILSTATLVSGVAALSILFLRGRHAFDAYGLSAAPLGVAIAGDSGTGKDTLCASLADVFGEGATAFLMGDDYHLYERRAPLWSVTTHLHPGANDLAAMASDAIALLRGDRVRSKHYDHASGSFTKPAIVESRELVVVNGLHSLTSASIRQRFDLTVFTSMDESLRRRLKIERDVRQRGSDLWRVVESIERRYAHAESFVAPQENLANIVFRVEPVEPLPAEDKPLSGPLELRLVVTLRDASFAIAFQRALVGLANCSCHVTYLDTPGVVQMVIYPNDIKQEDIAAIASRLIVRPEELFLHSPTWHGGSIGVIQVITVLALLERRRMKKVNHP